MTSVDWKAQGSDLFDSMSLGRIQALPVRKPIDNDDLFLRSVVKVIGFAANDPTPNFVGTAVFIAEDLLLTAAHVVFNPTCYGTSVFGGYAHNVRITSSILEITSSAQATTSYRVPDAYVNSYAAAADVAVVKLPKRVTNGLILRPQTVSDKTLEAAPLRVYGFPALTEVPTISAGICIEAGGQIMKHSASTIDGESGGPITINNAAGSEFIGVHTGRTGLPGDGIGIRFTSELINWINSFGEA